MTPRTQAVQRRTFNYQPSDRLRDKSAAYRVATDAYMLVCDLGCSGDIAAAVWSLVEREAKAAETAEART